MNAINTPASIALSTAGQTLDEGVDGTDLRGRALLVRVKVRVWGGQKRDRRMTREVCHLNEAQDRAVRVNKSLLGEAIAPVQAAETAVRDAVFARSLAWGDDGARILKGSAYIDFTRAIAAEIAAFGGAVDRFIAGYPATIEDARRRLGKAFREEDFPPRERLRERFEVKVTYLPIPSADDFRVELSVHEAASIRRSTEEALREGMQEAVKDLLRRMQEPVRRMAARLRLYDDRGGNGKVVHPFRDTLVGNLREMIGLVPALNLTEDPAISGLCDEMARTLAVHEAEDLRRSADLRATVAARADDILRKMQGAL